MNRTAPALLALTLAAFLTGAAPGESADPPGRIAFLASNSFVEADGAFHRWRVTGARIDREDPSAGFLELEIDVASVDTGIEQRDEHLRSEDFFEVATWPTARVRVHEARPDGRSQRGHPRYQARFDLRIRDIEKSLEGSFELIDDRRVEGTLSLDRTDFGVGSPRSGWNPFSVHDEVVVRFSAELPAP